MFRGSASSAGFCQRAEQNKSAGHQSDQIKQENGGPEIQSEPEQAIENDVDGEKDHPKSFHAIFCSSGCPLRQFKNDLSGERTRLACWRLRQAIANFLFEFEI